MGWGDAGLAAAAAAVAGTSPIIRTAPAVVEVRVGNETCGGGAGVARVPVSPGGVIIWGAGAGELGSKR